MLTRVFWTIVLLVIIVFLGKKCLQMIKILSILHKGTFKPINPELNGAVLTQCSIIEQPDNALKAPISHKECYWYEFKIEKYVTEKQSDGSRKKEWKTIRESQQNSFIPILNNGEQYLLATHGADITCKETETIFSTILPDIPPTNTETDMETYQAPLKKLFGLPDGTSSADSVKPSIKSQLMTGIIGSVLGSKDGITIDLTPPDPDSYRLTESRLTSNDVLTIFGYYQPITDTKIDAMLAIKEPAKLIRTMPIPTKETILNDLKQYMAQHQLKKVKLISNIFDAKQPHIISALTAKKLMYHYLSRLGLIMLVTVALMAAIPLVMFGNMKNQGGEMQQTVSHDRPWLQK